MHTFHSKVIELSMASIKYQLSDIRMDNQLSIKQTRSIFKQTHSFLQNLPERKKLAKGKKLFITMGNLVTQYKNVFIKETGFKFGYFVG